MPSECLFHDVVNEVARDLPADWTLQIELQKNAGWVTLINPNGEEESFASNFESLCDQVKDALTHAQEQ